MLPSAINFLANTAHMSSMMLIPNMVKELGGENFAVGVVVGVYGAMSFLAYYIFGRASDMYGRRTILRLGLFLSALAFLLQVTAETGKQLFFARALAGFCYGIAPAALIAYVYDARKSIGKFSSYGSLGWFFGSLAAGILAEYHNIFLASSLFLFLAFLVSLRMPSAGAKTMKVPFFPVELIEKNRGIYIQYLLRHLGANITWTILPLYLVSIGASYLWVGILYAINMGTQVLVMRGLDPVDNRKLILWGLVLSLLVFLGYGLATDYRQVIPIQIMLGVGWSFLYVGSLERLLENNLERATASGLLNSTINFAGIIGPLTAGAIITVASYRTAICFSALLCFAALAYNILERMR